MFQLNNVTFTYTHCASHSGLPMLGGQEGQDLPFILNFFHLFYLPKGHFPAL